MNSIFVYRDGRTEGVTSIDRSWLNPAAGVYVWVDLASPSIPESLVLTDTFAFHRLAVDEARLPRHSPTIDVYGGCLFAALAGADADVSFFVGGHFIVTVHWAESRAVADVMDSVRHGGKHFAEGPFAMFHRLAHATVEGLASLIEKQAACADGLERRVLEKASAGLLGEVLGARRAAFALAQRLSREREAIGRLASRGVVEISDEMAIRFRDVGNHLTRLMDDAQALEQRLGDQLTAASALAAKKGWM